MNSRSPRARDAEPAHSRARPSRSSRGASGGLSRGKKRSSAFIRDSGPPGPPATRLFFQRVQLEPAKKDLSAFGLEQDAALPERSVPALVDLHVIEEIDHVAAVANCLDAIPFTQRFLDVASAAESKDRLPGG